MKHPILNWFFGIFWRIGTFYNSHIEGEQPWKWWQKK